MAYFHLPDPGDPFNAVSPLQTQAGAVDSDEALQRSQAMAFHQGVFPSVAITCGTLDGTPTGPQGPDDQRAGKAVNECRYAEIRWVRWTPMVGQKWGLNKV